MSAGGKGHARRRENAAAVEANWDAIFSGHGREVQATGSNPVNVGSIPTAPATYVDNATGQVVNENWWPGDSGNA